MKVHLNRKNLKQIILLFIIAISTPFVIWGVATKNFNPNKKATEQQRSNIPVGNSPYLGPNNAPVTIIAFSDFECPFCKKFHDETFSQLLNAFPNKIKYVYKQFPLTQIHPNAQIASEASLCANDQGKFWQIHDMLFENQSTLSPDKINTIVTELNLNYDLFQQCLLSNLHKDEIDKDIETGNLYGVNGTPTFFINGIKVEGAVPFNYFKSIIDQELSNTPTATPTISPTPTDKPTISLNDDLYFIKNGTSVNFTTIGLDPNVSISPNDVIVGNTYVVEIKTQVQNSNKVINSDYSYIPVQFIINDIAIGENKIYLPIVSGQKDPSKYTFSGVFTVNDTTSKIRLNIDPENNFKETNESNNLLTFDFSAKAEPNSCGGTCGSNYNCKGDLFCYQGFCQNPNCPSSKSCGCVTQTVKPISKTIYKSPEPKITPLPSISPIPTNINTNSITVKNITYKPTTKPQPTQTPLANYKVDTQDILPIMVPIVAGIVGIYAFIVLIKSFKK